MSKSKKIAMTSAVAMVTAGVTTASNLTFTTKASANSHHHKKTSSTTKAVKYLQKQGLTKKQAKMVVSSDDFSNGHSTVENMHWNRRVKDVHQAGQKAYNKAIHSGKSKAQAVYDSFFGPIVPSVPASVLQLHNDVVVIADAEALSVCREKGVL